MAITPASKSHLEALINFNTAVTQRMLESLHRLGFLNMHLARELMAEWGQTGQHLMGSANPAEFANSAAHSGRGEQAGNALRNYQQGLADLLATGCAALAQAAESHLPNVSRSANALAEELMRNTREEASKASDRQRQMLEQMSAAGKSFAASGADGHGQARH
ncbi:hypothetical protein HSX11_00530 [Oxalobacteraceae bacterium]|nr:hypothetical protein [Oxalobacteraceae bacterium]